MVFPHKYLSEFDALEAIGQWYLDLRFPRRVFHQVIQHTNLIDINFAYLQ